jgi:hypothetical protein
MSLTRSAAHLGAVRERLVLLGLCHGFIFSVLLVGLSGALVWRMEPVPWLGNLADLPVNRVIHRPLTLSVEETIFGTRIRSTHQFPVGAVYVVRPSRLEIRVFSHKDPYSGCSLIYGTSLMSAGEQRIAIRARR